MARMTPSETRRSALLTPAPVSAAAALGTARTHAPATTGARTTEHSFATASARFTPAPPPPPPPPPPRYRNSSAGVATIPAKFPNTAWNTARDTDPSAALVSATPLPIVVGRHARTMSPSTSAGVRRSRASSAGARTRATTTPAKPKMKNWTNRFARAFVAARASSDVGRFIPAMRNIARTPMALTVSSGRRGPPVQPMCGATEANAMDVSRPKTK
mmetsp:Transcript_15315/g.55130  ORF Transcript_15315/g.55130 Transcript_15315/m.55130 type:complete len:216 (-) Transcript_15315:168-815(-)